MANSIINLALQSFWIGTIVTLNLTYEKYICNTYIIFTSLFFLEKSKSLSSTSGSPPIFWRYL